VTRLADWYFKRTLVAPQPLMVNSPKKATAQKIGLAGVVLTMIAGVIAVEGGYVNHPSDPGGETNMGITREVARTKHGCCLCSLPKTGRIK
jgi:hypothetical protein